MAKQKYKALHKADGRGDHYALLPYVALDKLLVTVGPRAVAVALAILRRFNGKNNGTITISMREIGEAIGSANNPANTAAIHELRRTGFLTVTSYPKCQRKANEYGFTFISSGSIGQVPATHDYLETKKTSVSGFDTRNASRVSSFDTRRKQRVSEIDTRSTETCDVSTAPGVSEIDTPIYYHPHDVSPSIGNIPDDTLKPSAPVSPSSALDVKELREFAKAFLASAGPGAQSRLAHAAQIPGGTLSKFLSGRSLPDRYRMPLQLVVGRNGGKPIMTNVEAQQLLATIGYQESWSDDQVVAAVSAAEPELRKWLPTALRIGGARRKSQIDQTTEARDATAA